MDFVQFLEKMRTVRFTIPEGEWDCFPLPFANSVWSIFLVIFHGNRYSKYASRYLSTSLQDVLGYPLESILPEHIFNYIHDDDRTVIGEAMFKYYQSINDLILEGSVFDFAFKADYRMRKQNGEYARILGEVCCYKIIPAETGGVFTFHNFIDISAFKNSNTVQFHVSGPEHHTLVFPDEELLDYKQTHFSFFFREKKFWNCSLRDTTVPELLNNFFESAYCRHHRRKMLAKAGLENTTELITFCLEHNIIWRRFRLKWSQEQWIEPVYFFQLI